MNFTNVSLVVLFTGILVVFLVLILLILIIKILSKLLNLFSKDKKLDSDIRIFSDKQLTKSEKSIYKDLNTDEKTIAAISAAVAYYYLNSEKKYKIYSIKRNFYADNRSNF